MLLVTLNAVGCAVNVAWYAAHGAPASLGAAVFAGLVALGLMAQMAGGKDVW